MNKQTIQPSRLDLKILHRFFIYIMTGSLLFISLTSCSIAESSTEIPVEGVSLSYQPVPTNMPEILSIEGNAEIRFPPSAHEIHAYTTGIRDIFIMVRFTMNASELSEFMKSTICNQPLEKSETSRNPPENNFDWWTPEKAKYSEECYGEKGFSHQQIIIDMSDQEMYIVYVSTSTN